MEKNPPFFTKISIFWLRKVKVSNSHSVCKNRKRAKNCTFEVDSEEFISNSKNFLKKVTGINSASTIKKARVRPKKNHYEHKMK